MNFTFQPISNMEMNLHSSLPGFSMAANCNEITVKVNSVEGDLFQGLLNQGVSGIFEDSMGNLQPIQVVEVHNNREQLEIKCGFLGKSASVIQMAN